MFDVGGVEAVAVVDEFEAFWAFSRAFCKKYSFENLGVLIAMSFLLGNCMSVCGLWGMEKGNWGYAD